MAAISNSHQSVPGAPVLCSPNLLREIVRHLLLLIAGIEGIEVEGSLVEKEKVRDKEHGQKHQQGHPMYPKCRHTGQVHYQDEGQQGRHLQTPSHAKHGHRAVS